MANATWVIGIVGFLAFGTALLQWHAMRGQLNEMKVTSAIMLASGRANVEIVGVTVAGWNLLPDIIQLYIFSKNDGRSVATIEHGSIAFARIEKGETLPDELGCSPNTEEGFENKRIAFDLVRSPRIKIPIIGIDGKSIQVAEANLSTNIYDYYAYGFIEYIDTLSKLNIDSFERQFCFIFDQTKPLTSEGHPMEPCSGSIRTCIKRPQ